MTLLLSSVFVTSVTVVVLIALVIVWYLKNGGMK